MKSWRAALVLLGSGSDRRGPTSSALPSCTCPPASSGSDQGILTPVPIALELPTDLPVRRALVHYKVHGASEWRTLELLRDGTRYTGAIPCLEVSTITGDLLYYIRLHDAEGAVIAQSGTRHAPYRVVIHHESERPDLAGDRPRCPTPRIALRDCPGVRARRSSVSHVGRIRTVKGGKAAAGTGSAERTLVAGTG